MEVALLRNANFIKGGHCNDLPTQVKLAVWFAPDDRGRAFALSAKSAPTRVWPRYGAFANDQKRSA